MRYIKAGGAHIDPDHAYRHFTDALMPVLDAVKKGDVKETRHLLDDPLVRITCKFQQHYMLPSFSWFFEYAFTPEMLSLLLDNKII